MAKNLTLPDRARTAQTSKTMEAALTDRTDDPWVNAIYQANTRHRRLEQTQASAQDIEAARGEIGVAVRLFRDSNRWLTELGGQLRAHLCQAGAQIGGAFTRAE
jgi:hypothetical protein